MRLLSFSVALVLVSGKAAPGSFSIRGYCKSFFVAYRSPRSLDEGPVLGSVSNRLRVELLSKASGVLSFHVAYDVIPRVQDHSMFERGPGLAIPFEPWKYRAMDFDRRLYPAEPDTVRSFGVFHNLDRAVLTARTIGADIYVGRQAIAWGSARVVNPVDVIAPFTFDELDTEERVGVDAVRVRVPLGVMSELDAGYVFGEAFRFDNSAFFVRSKVNARATDVSLLLVGFQENLLAGADVARAIGGAGAWAEVAQVFTGAMREESAGGEDYVRASVGADYSFSGSTYGYCEYHFNQAGSAKPETYLTNLTEPGYAEGAVYLLGRHYMAVGVEYQMTPLLSFDGQALCNLSDGSVSLSPRFEWSPAQDVYLSIGAYAGLGSPARVLRSYEGDDVTLLRSEFGAYPDVFFTSFRIYI